MNTALVSRVIPAFYQIYMNSMCIDRFDDIWSGILLKKIAGHLGDNLSIDEPLAYHNKRLRTIYSSLLDA